jgi:hypothetical protein
MISFDNFPDNANAFSKLTPRSSEALKRTGFKLDDLLLKSPEEINAKYADGISDKALIDKRVAHHEEKRRANLNHLKVVRGGVVEEEQKGMWNSQNVTVCLFRRAEPSSTANHESIPSLAAISNRR